MIHSRADLIEYALRKLGKPVLNIEVDMTQVEDRVDEALQFFQDFHYDGTERIYLKHQITGSQVIVNTTVGFLPNEIVKGTSGNYFQIIAIEPTKFITKFVFSPAGISGATFVVGETITGQTSGAIATFASKVVGDIEDGSVPISEMVTGVIRVIPWFHASAPTANSNNFLFDPKYQVIMSTFQNLGSSSMIYYNQLMSHISLMDQVLRPVDSLRFNRKMSKVFLEIDWPSADIGGFLIFECYRILDPEVFVEIYNDRMLKKLVTAKVKYQWSTNVQKYSGIQLLGGVTIDASTLMAQAVAEIEAAEEEIKDAYQEMPIGFIG